MTEKKTFKNPRVTSYIDKVWIGWGEPYALDQGTVEFPKDKWNWEVTFTKKPKPVEVGSVVRHKNWPAWLHSGEPIYFVVKAIVDKQAWIGYKDQKREDMLASLDSLYFDE